MKYWKRGDDNLQIYFVWPNTNYAYTHILLIKHNAMHVANINFILWDFIQATWDEAITESSALI